MGDSHSKDKTVLRCPRCGCTDLRAPSTAGPGGQTVRGRLTCRHCGKEVREPKFKGY